MLKFFRRVRKRLLEKGQSNKYFTYAIGETLLVMVGILLALQVNNWNERRKQRILETEYLQQLATDLASDTTYYNERIVFYRRGLNQITQFVAELYDVQESKEEVQGLLRNFNLSTDPLNTYNPTYLELMSTGSLGVIESAELKAAITNYYRLNEQYASNVEEFNNTSNLLVVEVVSVASGVMKYSIQLNKDPNAYSAQEWAYFNQPSSKEFQALETLGLIVRNRNGEFIRYFEGLLLTARNLIRAIEEDLATKG